MSFRVAVASSDGKVINQHFGRSRQFLIFDLTDRREAVFLELRASQPPCGLGEHDEDLLAKAVELLSDCRFLLAAQIGPGAEHALRAKGIRAFAVAGYIDEVLEKLAKSAYALQNASERDHGTV